MDHFSVIYGYTLRLDKVDRISFCLSILIVIKLITVVDVSCVLI